LFGAPALEEGREPVRLSPQQAALVTLVYGHGSAGIERARAVERLWDREADSSARHRMRQLLVDLRRRCAAPLIDSVGERLCPRADVESDLRTFEESVAGGSLVRAARLLAQGFARLPSRALADAYHDWREATEGRLIRRLRAEAEARWIRAAEAGDWTSAGDAAEALHILDPSDHDAAGRSIEALGRAGNLAGAERVFAACLDALAAAPPPPALLDAIERVRRTVRCFATAEESSLQEVPLVGWRDALAAARAVFDEVRSGGFRLVLISGESGIGKTRILRELHREAALADFRCLVAQAIEPESRIPLNPILDCLRGIDLAAHLTALGSPWNAVVGSMLPAGALAVPRDPPAAIQEGALPRRLLDAFALLFERIATEHPTLLLLDDLQWADATTIAALQFMQRRWSRGSLGVIATLRTDQQDRASPAAGLLSTRTDPEITHIRLEELAPNDALLLVRRIANDAIDDDVAKRICALAGPHPLYLTELARDYLAGRLRLDDLSSAELPIPVSLKQILDSRLACLGDRARKIAGLMAVAARPLRLGEVARLSALGLDDAADAIDELRKARLVEFERDRVRVAHELFRSAIYRSLSEPRRALLHQAVADQLRADSGDELAGELAVHYERAGESRLAAELGWVAAERAMESGAVAEAAHFYRVVMGNALDVTRRAEATAAAARALHLAGDMTRANPLLELGAARLREVGHLAEARRLDILQVEALAEVGGVPLAQLVHRVREIKAEAHQREDWEAVALALDAELHLLHRAGDLEGIQRLFQEMRAAIAAGTPEAAQIAYGGLALAVLFGDPEEALRAAREAVRLATPGSSRRRRALLRLIVVLHQRGMLELPESQLVVREAREAAERSGDVLLRISIENNLAANALDAGDLERAETLMARPVEVAGTATMNLNRFIRANTCAELAVAFGDYRQAESAYLEAMKFATQTTPSYLLDLANAGLGLCALEMGRLSEARRREHQLHEAPRTWYYDPTPILAFRARLLERRGYVDDAVDVLTKGAAGLENRLVLAWLKVRALQLRLLLKLGAPDVGALAAECASVAERLNLAHRAREFRKLQADLAFPRGKRSRGVLNGTGAQRMPPEQARARSEEIQKA
jgi:predicted ATPase/DNA-binding SARP family transcriptional activator